MKKEEEKEEQKRDATMEKCPTVLMGSERSQVHGREKARLLCSCDSQELAQKSK